MATPTGKGHELDAFNAQLRADPEYRAFLRSMGVNPDAPVKLSGAQRSQAEQWIRQRVPDLGGKFQIDPAGNINTDHGLSTAWSNPYFRYPLIAGAALGTMGAAGVFGGGAAGASAGAGGGAAAGGAAAGGGAGLGTAAGVAGAGGGVWSAINKFVNSPLGSELLETGGGLVATKLQMDAANKAAETQAQSLREALDFEKQVYQDDKDFFQPWGDLGRGSAARLSELTSARRPPVTADSLWQGGQLSSGPRSGAPSISALTSGGSARTPAASASLPRPLSPWEAGENAQPPVSTTMPVPMTPESDLPAGVPPGSIRVNGGINPDVWAYQTPDGRVIFGTRNRGTGSPWQTAPGYEAPSEPVSTHQPVPMNSSGRTIDPAGLVADGGGTVKMRLTPTLVKDVPSEFVETWKARGAVEVGA